jgi:hypothetical protein
MRFSTFPHRRRGATLVEVLCGLVVLGTLLASVTIARGRFLRQWSIAEKRLAVAEALEPMLAEWVSYPSEAVPREGMLTAQGCVWRTTLVPNAAAAQLDAVVCCVDVFEAKRARTSPPVLSVEFLVREGRRTPATKPAAGGQP